MGHVAPRLTGNIGLSPTFVRELIAGNSTGPEAIEEAHIGKADDTPK